MFPNPQTYYCSPPRCDSETTLSKSPMIPSQPSPELMVSIILTSSTPSPSALAMLTCFISKAKGWDRPKNVCCSSTLILFFL